MDTTTKKQTVTDCNSLNEILNLATSIQANSVDCCSRDDAKRICDLCKQIDLQGNAAKMREALMQIRDSVYIDPDDNKCHSDIDASDLREICDSALAAPPRNCDRFVNETAAQIAFLREMCFLDVTSLDNDPFDCWTNLMQYRYAKWLYAEAKGKTK